ncbi:hypothetical protein D9615_010411 [Tricholomella constricta]|uniref:HAT C-terminal dimerisation domain-containing protein n=1 Tax=Tricholomella constricta TaxID=117010 RepID=A0A8H5GPU0_9AGAR|nr:hypothetical protein D9615_010411 [Tricholomella constricta]
MPALPKKKGKAKSKAKARAKAKSKAVSDDSEEVEDGSQPGEAPGDDDGAQEEEDLDERQAQGIPERAAPSKKDSTRDLLTVFSDRLEASFPCGKGEFETLEGQWCLICRAETEASIQEKLRPKKTRRECFFLGSNSTCRGHIASFHFEEYERRCDAAKPKIPMATRCIPLEVQKARNEQTKKDGQRKLDFVKVNAPKEFTRAGVLKAVSVHVACDDQALLLADKASFRNCLVSMRPEARRADLPSSHEVRAFIHNAFVERLNDLKRDIEKAPGKVSCTADGWSADTTKYGYLGMTAHWIDVDDSGKWTLRAEVVGFRLIHGTHAGSNLGRYFVGLCDRVGIMSRSDSKLYTVTLDNTSSNNKICDTIASQHNLRQLPTWSAFENQLGCLEHVVNLATIDVMGYITKLAAVETATAIWEYDPSEPTNRVLGGSLDTIAAIRTLAIKIQASGQRIQYFEGQQLECGITKPLKITLHSNVRWGSAYNMLDRAYKLRQAIDLFTSGADRLYGPITTIRSNGRITKKIAWSAFTLTSADWARVHEAKTILADSNCVLHHFSAEQQPTLYRALPALEDLQTLWEAKLKNPMYVLYHAAIQCGLDKLNKYYSRFDEKPAYVLALVLHPYFKIQYIKLAWGGMVEQAAEIADGNLDAKNWQAEAELIVDNAMAEYWRTRPQQPTVSSSRPPPAASDEDREDSFLSEFDRHRLTLLTDGTDSHWQSELRRYLKDVPADVTRDTDIVAWWSVHAKLYPTLARIALDILPSQASSVPCERVFSSAKLTATDRRARLGAIIFEELQIMKAAWCPQLIDHAKSNSQEIEVVEEEFESIFAADEELEGWDQEDM